MAVLDKNGTEYLWNKAKEKFAAKDDMPETPEGVVLYTEQSLTDDQKAQARVNIGAVGTVEATEEVYTYVFTGEDEIVSPNGSDFFRYLDGVTYDFLSAISGVMFNDKQTGTLQTLPVPEVSVFNNGYFDVFMDSSSYWMIAWIPSDNFNFNGFTFPKCGAYFQDNIDQSIGADTMDAVSFTSTVPYTKTTQKIDKALLPDVTWDDVKDKPFKDTTKEVYTYVFTGEEIFVDANGIECFYLEGVTTEFVNGVYSLTYDNNGEIGTQNISKIGESDSGEFVSIIFTDYWLMLGYAKKDGATAEGMTFPKQGFYFMKISGDAIPIISFTSTVPYTVEDKSLKEEYLPESVSGVIIRSSTSGSTKKFKLTVDDSGTITATEVV